MEPHAVIKYPVSTEKSIRLMESENKLLFVVDNKATKADIKKAFESIFKVKVAKVNTVNTMKGEKRAYIRIEGTPAIEIATQLGLM